MPLHRIRVTQVDLGVQFYHHNRTYVLADEDERKKHPGNVRDGVLAYMLVPKGNRVPVAFNPLEEVYIER